MRGMVATLCLMLALAAYAAPVTGYVLEGTGFVPARVLANWLRCMLTLAEDGTVTIDTGAAMLSVTPNRMRAAHNGKAITLPAPAFILDGVTYLPARTAVEVFDLEFSYDRATKRFSLDHGMGDPLVVALTPFPRPDWVSADTLAGLTPGDHLALAIAKWGEPINTDDSQIPDARAYTFQVDEAGGVALVAHARGNRILLVQTYLTGKVPLADIEEATARAATAGGARLGQDAPAAYGEARDDYSHPSEDIVLINYLRPPLTLIVEATFIEDTVAPTVHTLASQGFPKDWLPLRGPMPGGGL